MRTVNFYFDLERGTFTLLPVVESQHRIPVLRVETAVTTRFVKISLPAFGVPSELIAELDAIAENGRAVAQLAH